MHSTCIPHTHDALHLWACTCQYIHVHVYTFKNKGTIPLTMVTGMSKWLKQDKCNQKCKETSEHMGSGFVIFHFAGLYNKEKEITSFWFHLNKSEYWWNCWNAQVLSIFIFFSLPYFDSLCLNWRPRLRKQNCSTCVLLFRPVCMTIVMRATKNKTGF